MFRLLTLFEVLTTTAVLYFLGFCCCLGWKWSTADKTFLEGNGGRLEEGGRTSKGT